MKKTLFTVLVCVALGFSTIACSKNEDLPGNGDPENNLPNEAQAFVGIWHCTASLSGGAGYIFFSEDGKCVIEDYYPSTSHTYLGYWSFDKETNILATDINNYQYTVTLSTPSSWAATYYQKGNPYSVSYQKGGNYQTIIFLLYHCSWELIDGNYDYIDYIKNLRFGGFSSEIKEDDNADDYVFKLFNNGSLVVDNMYNLSKISLHFTNGERYSKYILNTTYYWN